MTIDDLLHDLRLEIKRAEAKWGPYNSAHEGISVIREEWEELWEHVRANTAESPEAIQEALHVACTAIRFAQGASTGWRGNRNQLCSDPCEDCNGNDPQVGAYD